MCGVGCLVVCLICCVCQSVYFVCLFCVSICMCTVLVQNASDEEKLDSQTSRRGRHGAKDKKQGPHRHSDTL